MPERGSIKVTVVGATDVGRVREHNEDNFLVADMTAAKRAENGESLSSELGEKGILLAVADGMGGAASGELASEIAVETVYERLRQRALLEEQVTTSEMSTGLAETLVGANEKIWERSQAETEHRGMGTTMTAAFLLGEDLALAQVGDSRAYLMRKGKLVQVTKDQSLIAQLIREGTLTPEEAEKIGGQNIILQALGVESTVAVESKVMKVLAGDLLVLCSDGLTGMVKDEQIEKTLAEAKGLKAASARLVELANDGGGRDNITVILAKFEGPGLRSPMKPLDAEEAEAGGRPTAFAPPPPPEAKSGSPRLALLGGAGAILILVLLFFLFSGGSADVTFTFPAPGARGMLTPLSGEGEPIALSPAGGAREVEVPELPPGRYLLTAELERYQPVKEEVEFARGELKMRVDLRPLPGDLVIVPQTPRVQVVIEPAPAASGVPPFQRTVNFLSSLASQVANQLPAGKLQLVQSRPGFETATQFVEMPPGGGPEGNIEVRLDALEPIRADVELRFASALGDGRGRVEIVDEYGDEVWAGPIPPGGVLKAKMRVGEHTMKVTHPLFEGRDDFDLVVTENGAETGGPIELPPAKGKLLVSVREPGAKEFVKIVSRDGAMTSMEPILEGGRIEVAVPPGDYDVTYLRAGVDDVTKQATIRSAETTKVEF